MLICMHNTLYEHFKLLFHLYLTKTLGMTITYNTGSLIHGSLLWHLTIVLYWLSSVYLSTPPGTGT